ncbi:TPA: hypothetical protein QH656_000995 [Klebsiella aerogenes]|nr:hypothetical protein [Klebsiella aerogenes]
METIAANTERTSSLTIKIFSGAALVVKANAEISAAAIHDLFIVTPVIHEGN